MVLSGNGNDACVDSILGVYFLIENPKHAGCDLVGSKFYLKEYC